MTTGDQYAERAKHVLPNGMFGHQSVRGRSAKVPQFFDRAKGTYLWDCDGKRYLDFMCAFGPNLFGYGHDSINQAYVDQLGRIDAATGPSPLIVELAEAYTAQIDHAGWAIFCKNGTDATSTALRIARAQTASRKVLVARGSYHGSADWCTPIRAGTLDTDRSHLIYFEYNDTESLIDAAAQAGEDLAAIMVTPHKHDLAIRQEPASAEFAGAARNLCDQAGALLILDEVRTGFRTARGSSWAHLGVEPDLSAWGKVLANGHPLSCVLGSETARSGAESIFVTGSYWFAAGAMAAALRTLELINSTYYLEQIISLGTHLRTGLDTAAARTGTRLSQSGPVQMPLIMIEDASGHLDVATTARFTDALLDHGVYFHPSHNMFLNSAMTLDDIDHTIESVASVLESDRLNK